MFGPVLLDYRHPPLKDLGWFRLQVLRFLLCRYRDLHHQMPNLTHQLISHRFPPFQLFGQQWYLKGLHYLHLPELFHYLQIAHQLVQGQLLDQMTRHLELSCHLLLLSGLMLQGRPGSLADQHQPNQRPKCHPAK